MGQVLSEDGPWSADTVSYTYSNREKTGLSLMQPNASAWTQNYAYDSIRRLTNVSSPAGPFGYEYTGVGPGVSPGNLVKKLALPSGANITNAFDTMARLTATHLRNSAGTLLNSDDYSYNLGNQRTQQVFTAGNYVNYGYDNIGQLQTAYGYEQGGGSRLQEKLGYAYDTAGNLNYRTNNALTQTFGVNTLNELTTVSRAGTLTVAGTTTSQATDVTVNNLSASRYTDNTFARESFSLDDGTNTFTAVGHDSLGRWDTNVCVAYLPSSVSCSYDLNGNLLSDGRRLFTYDDENQLTTVIVTNGPGSSTRSDFAYDGKMRRRWRFESLWNGSGWLTNQSVRYVYDGNLVVQERDGNNLPLVTYTRGKGLGGGLQAAGGIGGLLARSEGSTVATAGSHFVHCAYHADANGNITCMIAANQLLVAIYTYDPYGRTLTQSGRLADANLYRFSSKESHATSGLLYYLYRSYDPNLQRWINRDPIEERGSFNLYSFVRNAPQDQVDPTGLSIWPPGGPPLWDKPKIERPELPYYPSGPRGSPGNCYNYACNRPPSPIFNYPNMYPGERAGLPDLSSANLWTCFSILERVRADYPDDSSVGPPSAGDRCPKYYHKIRPEVTPKGDGFHFKRQNPDGTWSEKKDIRAPTFCNPNRTGYPDDIRCPDICVPD